MQRVFGNLPPNDTHLVIQAIYLKSSPDNKKEMLQVVKVFYTFYKLQTKYNTFMLS